MAASVNVRQYRVYVSTCPELTGVDSCQTSVFLTTCSADSDSCSHFVGGNRLRKGTVYTIRVLAQNSAGLGYLSRAIPFTVAWQVVPILKEPASSSLPLRVAEHGGSSRVWLSGLARSSITIMVENFPPPPPGKDLRVTVHKAAGSSAYGSATLVGKHYTDSYLQSEEQVSGVGVICTFVVRLPAFSPPMHTWTGNAVARLASSDFVSAPAVEFGLYYFKYPEAEVQHIGPSVGDIGGGTLVNIVLREPIGSETRHGAGYETLRSVAPVMLSVTLHPTGGLPLSPILLARLVSSENVDLDRVKLLLEMPACLDPLGGSFRVRVFRRQSEAAPSSSIYYDFRPAYFSSIMPEVGLTTGQQDLSLLIRGLRHEQILQGVPVTVTINGN